MGSFYDFSVLDGEGRTQPLADWQGQVLLVVNVASQCGFTPQYAGLEALQRRFAGRGFSVLAFPCNQFGGQEPGSNAEIAEFCRSRFDVSFPLFAKIDVNGDAADPAYVWLKAQQPGLLGSEAIKWNFTKFLIGRDGQVLRRYAPQTEPEAIADDIQSLLDAA
ncbi:glutathione peroxidase [Chitinilyticum litopenaei]|uniref:glutathione peroxidase n=1 Tax=Chitinilyticum litopenaei TaxID=1121276 RepID=UPI000410E5C8|nr:glutathione peroxidase [Chitinilyticum litopenaei]